MRISNEADYPLEKIQEVINNRRAGILISGGEPTIDKHFSDTLKLINKLSYPIANLETNGYNLVELMKKIDKHKRINISYSPKMFSEKELENEMKITEQLIKYPNVYFKVVYENREDVLYYLDWLSKLNVNQRTYLMIEGTTRADLIRNSGAVFDACEEYKFNFSSRDHIIYGFI
jgi:organic radical activating enzyme